MSLEPNRSVSHGQLKALRCWRRTLRTPSVRAGNIDPSTQRLDELLIDALAETFDVRCVDEELAAVLGEEVEGFYEEERNAESQL